jgi:predicted methyltransferase
MRTLAPLFGFALAFSACASQPKAPVITAASPHIVAAVASATRPAEDRARDAARKPAEMLAFAGVAPGQRVADFIPGGGYFTRILSEAVGPSGKLYALIPPAGAQREEPPIKAVVAQYPNAAIVQQSFATLTIPEPVDVIFTAQNYHDLHLARFNLDVAAVNRQIFAALKPGGVYVVVDHSAKAGASVDVADSLHRIDPAIVKRELEAAGFVLDAESNALRNPADTLGLGVFDPAIRGHTDQFVLRFRKPK